MKKIIIQKQKNHMIKLNSTNIIPLDLIKINEKDVPIEKFNDLLINFKEDLNKRTNKIKKYKEVYQKLTKSIKDLKKKKNQKKK